MRKLTFAVLTVLIAGCMLASCGGSSPSNNGSEASKAGLNNSSEDEDYEEDYEDDDSDEEDEDEDYDEDSDEDDGDWGICKISEKSKLMEQPIESAEDEQIYNLMMEYAGDTYNNTWNIGSARKLRGKTYVLELWLTERGTLWNRNEMSRIQGEINTALDWLKGAAAQYGSNLSFEVGSYHGDGSGIIMNRIPHSYEDMANHPNLILEALKVVGYTGVEECYDQLKGMPGIENVLVLMLLNCEGRSCANIFSRGHIGYYETDFLEGVTIFKAYDNDPRNKMSANIVIHELLHAFGAWDMYGDKESGVSQEADQFAQAYYPNEIMGNGAYSPLNQLEISPLTAWLTGLSTEYHEEWYWSFMRDY